VSELPTGTVTFLFTDIEGSTRLLHDLANTYVEALGEHRRVLRQAFAAHGGVEVDTQGDAFFVAFGRASEALAAAREGQAALAEGPIRVRMGVHTGEPLATDDGYVGIDVHRAARIAAAGHGGQILVSQTTCDLVGAAGLRSLGEHRLKDLTTSERIYQLGDAEFPPLKSLNQTNLPLQPTPLIGRARELSEVLELLRSSRLLTLTGSGGSGKTRLALQAAAEVLEEFPGGAWFVSLAAVHDPDLLEPTIGSVVGAKDDLGGFLRSNQLLLLLDNLEQLLPEVAPMVARLLAAPGVKVLATSRERLAVAAEQEYSVPTLQLDEAAALFIARARQLKPGFTADEHVSEIARRLDGLPLALELAAARVKVLTAQQIAARLGHSLELLTGGGRDSPERQRTLRATIEWSSDLLSDEERRLFARLAAFAGSFDLEAAERICNAELDALESLIDKSLLRQTEDGRFFILETIREFAQEQLAASSEAAEMRHRHARLFLALGLKAGAHVQQGSEQLLWLGRLERELPNLRSALELLSMEDPAAELDLATALAEFFRLHGYAREGLAWLEGALSRSDTSHPARVRALEDTAYLAYQCKELDLAQRRVDELRTIANEGSHPSQGGRVLHLAAILALARGDYATAKGLGKECIKLLGADSYAPYAHQNLGYVSLLQGEIAEAKNYILRSFELVRDEGHDAPAGGFTLLATAALLEGNGPDAARLIRENLWRERELGLTPYFAAQSLQVVAALAAELGDARTSAQILAAADAMLERSGTELGPLFQRVHDSTRSTLRAELDAETLAAQREAGRELTGEGVYALALAALKDEEKSPT
jgi:predicted ATPase